MGWSAPLTALNHPRRPTTAYPHPYSAPRPRLRTRIRPRDGVFAPRHSPPTPSAPRRTPPVGTSRSRRHHLRIRPKRSGADAVGPSPEGRKNAAHRHRAASQAKKRRAPPPRGVSGEKTPRTATARRLFAVPATDRRRRRQALREMRVWWRRLRLVPTGAHTPSWGRIRVQRDGRGASWVVQRAGQRKPRIHNSKFRCAWRIVKTGG
jgi:hypothetical protein